MNRLKTLIPSTLGMIGGFIVLYVGGAILHDTMRITELGTFVFFSGWVILIGFALVFIYKVLRMFGLLKPLEKIISSNKRKKSTKELLTLKELYDSKLITKEEFDKKASELKKDIL